MNNRTTHIYEIENARITYRNFSGEERKFNNKGKRNFNLILTPEQAAMFEAEGFNVRHQAPREEGGEGRDLLSVNVGFEYRPPKIVVINGKRKTELNEDTVCELDYADIDYIDMTIRPYYWEVGDKSGVTAYLNSMYVTLVEDRFAAKYEDEAESELAPF